MSNSSERYFRATLAKKQGCAASTENFTDAATVYLGAAAVQPGRIKGHVG